MKLIDLLVKIANREELPKKIIFFNDLYEKCWGGNEYYCEKNNEYLSSSIDYSVLNHEIIIIQDKHKKMEKLEKTEVRCDTPLNGRIYLKKEYKHTKEEICDKLNEVIDKINYLLEKSGK